MQKLKIKLRTMFAPTRVLKFEGFLGFAQLQEACRAKLALGEDVICNYTLWYRDNEFEDLQIIDQSDLDACIDEARILQQLSSQDEVVGAETKGLQLDQEVKLLRVVIYLLEKEQSVEQVLGTASMNDETFGSHAGNIELISDGFHLLPTNQHNHLEEAQHLEVTFTNQDRSDDEDWREFSAFKPAQASQPFTEPIKLNTQEQFQEMLFDFLSVNDETVLLAKYSKFAELLSNATEIQKTQISKIVPALRKDSTTITQLEPQIIQPTVRVVTPPALLVQTQPPIQRVMHQPAPKVCKQPPRQQTPAGYEMIRGFFDGMSAMFDSLGSTETGSGHKQ
jgi:hypothetical protein